MSRWFAGCVPLRTVSPEERFPPPMIAYTPQELYSFQTENCIQRNLCKASLWGVLYSMTQCQEIRLETLLTPHLPSQRTCPRGLLKCQVRKLFDELSKDLQPVLLVSKQVAWEKAFHLCPHKGSSWLSECLCQSWIRGRGFIVERLLIE